MVLCKYAEPSETADDVMFCEWPNKVLRPAWVYRPNVCSRHIISVEACDECKAFDGVG